MFNCKLFLGRVIVISTIPIPIAIGTFGREIPMYSTVKINKHVIQPQLFRLHHDQQTQNRIIQARSSEM